MYKIIILLFLLCFTILFFYSFKKNDGFSTLVKWKFLNKNQASDVIKKIDNYDNYTKLDRKA